MLRPLHDFDIRANMKSDRAIDAFAALAQATRLRVFRLLMDAAPDGRCAGEIAAGLDLQPATLSFHLRQLEQAGLIRGRRSSRNIVYEADLKGTRALVAFLTRDCCGGHPEICAAPSAAGSRDGVTTRPPGA